MIAWVMLADMPVEHLSCRDEEGVGDMSEDLLCELPCPTSNGGVSAVWGISPIGQLRSIGTPTVLESEQARIIRSRATHIELASSVPFPFLNRIPQQEGHSTQVVESGVGASILVDEGVLERESKDARDRPSVLRGHADLYLIAQAVH